MHIVVDIPKTIKQYEVWSNRHEGIVVSGVPNH